MHINVLVLDRYAYIGSWKIFLGLFWNKSLFLKWKYNFPFTWLDHFQINYTITVILYISSSFIFH